MKYTKPFKDLSKKDADIAGGKGASLGEMLNAGIPVPDGFVILATTFDEFLHKADLIQEVDAILEKVDHKTISSVEYASENIQELIKHANMPDDIKVEIESQFRSLDAEFVAVRSSATAEDGADHAWAGQLDSYLNTTEEMLFEKVQHCWASLFTPRAIFYRFEKGLDTTKISVAVVVQKMVNSEKSGIAFSVHPVTEDRNQIIIEAGFGLGEAIVSGSVTPDSYVISKRPREIIDINISNQARAMYRKTGGGNEWLDIPEKGNTQVFTGSEILALAEIIMTIENHYGFPSDIEWAYEGGKFYIVQSRPITTLSNKDNIDSRKTSLSRIYSREKSLLYFSMWNDSDRLGYKHFLNYDVQNNLFIVRPRGQKGSVWYSLDEFSEIEEKLKNQIDKNFESFTASIFERLSMDWDILLPYLNEEKIIKDGQEFELYYNTLVHWWSAMNTVFGVPDMIDVSEDFKNKILSIRTESEKFTEKMNKLMVSFFETYFPSYKDLSHVVTPNEVIKLAAEELEYNEIESIRNRLSGCFMLNGVIYSFQSLVDILNKNGIVLEKVEVENVAELKGNSSFKGIATGTVRIVHGFKDLDLVQEGDVLVTEMTNPDYVPTMKKIVAIVTDEGGVTCHAAIVSRELKIPCILGTKIATQILKNGDTVEVDADNGIVRILKRGNTRNSALFQDKLPNIEKSIWYRQRFDACPHFMFFLGDAHISNIQHTKYPFGQKIAYAGFSKNRADWYHSLEELEYTASKIIEASDNDPHIGKKMVEDFLPWQEEFYQTCLELKGKDLSKLDNTELLETYNTLAKVYTNKLNSSPLIDGFALSTDTLIASKIKSFLEGKNMEDKFIEYFAILTAPTFLSFLQEEEIALLELDNDLVENHQEKWFWIRNNYTKDHIISVEEFERRLEEYKNIDKGQKIEEIKSLSIDHKNEKEKLIKELSLPKEIQVLLEVTDDFNAWQDERKKGTFWATHYFSILMEEFARRTKYSLDQLKYAFPPEMGDILNEKIHPDELDQRINYCMIIWTVSSYDVTTDIRLIEKLDRIGTGEFAKTDELRGFTASKGKVIGRVKITESVEEIAKVEPGDILVSVMTRPDYLPAMQKAAAFITDEGGITCHAAIVAREMRKPCIIGTKIATKILKDGDLVEVDADKGIIKILNK